MTIPKKPTSVPEALEEFIAGVATPETQTQASGERQAEVLPFTPPVLTKVRKRPIRQKEVVLRQTFVLSKNVVDKLEALAYYSRQTKKAVLEAALLQYFADKKIKPIPREAIQ